MRFDKVPVWVKMWIPRELWGEDNKGVNFAASLVGESKFMDENTRRRRSRLEFAIFCVVILVEQTLKIEFKVIVGRDAAIKVEYESILVTCSECKVFGHEISSCPNIVTRNANQGARR